MKIKSTLGYTTAALTVAVALLTPFKLMGVFEHAFGHMGLHVDEMYSGGPVVRTVAMSGYAIDVHRTVKPHMMQNANPFVQLAWGPVSAMPLRVSDLVDIDGDGKPDMRVSFDAPKDDKAPLHVNVESLNPSYQAMRDVGKTGFSKLIARVDDKIIVRVPVNSNK